ncbi:MAG TPA: DUF2608 domain-containing protein [Lacipirellulaceae bacterium]|jgi:hypothetical protein
MSISPLRRSRASALATLAVIALLLSGRSSAIGGEIRDTSDFADVAAAVDRYCDQYGAEHVLLVLDLDNTLLAMNHPLGSDQWFEWQRSLIANDPKSPECVADSFPGLLDAQGMLYNLGRMHPTQKDLPELMKKLQDRGISTVVLTSRGDEFRNATERELKRNGFDFARSALPVKAWPRGRFFPYDPKKPDGYGLTNGELDAYGVKEKDLKPISYENGIMMTAGQHKGIMLLTLLARAERDIKAVVHDEDSERNVGRIFSALTNHHVEITGFHNTRQDDEVKNFDYGDKSDIDKRWHQLNDTLQAVFE